MRAQTSAEMLPLRPVCQQQIESPGKRLRVTGRKGAVLRIRTQHPQVPGNGGRDDGDATGHRLEQSVRRTLGKRRQDEHVARTEELRDFANGAREAHSVPSNLAREFLPDPPHRPVTTDDQETGKRSPRRPCLQEIVHPLLRSKTACEQHDGAGREVELRSKGSSLVLPGWLKLFRVDSIRHSHHVAPRSTRNDQLDLRLVVESNQSRG